MDFSTMFGLMNPQAGDPFSMGALFQNPDEAAKMMAGAGVPPPAQGQGFMDWMKGLAPNLPPMGAAPFAGLGFPGTPAVDPTKVPTVPFGQSNLGQTLGMGGAPFGPSFNEALGTPPGLPGAGQAGTQQRATVPDILAPEATPLPQARPPGAPSEFTGPTLEQAGKAQTDSPAPPTRGFNPE